MNKPAVLATLVAGAVFMAGCGVNAPEPDAPEHTVTSTSGEVAAVSEEEALLALFDQATALTTEQDRARHDAHQAAIAQCMADAGFEYLPRPWVDPALAGQDPFWNAEFMATYGYGISTDPPPPASIADPNDPIRAALSEAALAEYHTALTGDPTGGVGETGCVQVAAEGLYDESSSQPGLVTAVWAEISRRREAQWAVEGTMRLEDVSDCVVAAGGFPYDPRSQVQATFFEEAWAELADPTPAQIAEFQEWEIAVASAEWECALEYQQGSEEFGDEIIRDVVGEYRAELEALAEEMGLSGPGS